MFHELSSPEPLLLTALFHDIGKVGKSHARKGVGITRNILKRFHYDKERTEDILFLIGHHLLLVETATRRDLNDEKVVVQCARTIEDMERLKMLYLLTWADSRATGPRAWNEWIANLVQELFFKVLHILEREELATPDVSRNVHRKKRKVHQMVSSGMDSFQLDRYFEVMSPRYLLNSTHRDIVAHLEMTKQFEEQLKNLGSGAFFLEAKKDESGGCWEVTFMAKDRPGLFSDIAGVMALNSINILSAHIYTWQDGTAVDIFRVSEPLDTIHPGDTWEKVKRDLRDTFNGKLSLTHRLRKKAIPSILSKDHHLHRRPKVMVDNDASDFFTLIEIFADDGIGLLYGITHTLFNLGLDIRIAKIATKGDLIADVFYVRDLDGQKVEDKERVGAIHQALLYELAQKVRINDSGALSIHKVNVEG